MLLSSEFLLTKNSHKTPSEARSTHEHAPTSSTQHAKHANTASHNPNKHHICFALHLLPACCHQHCMACLLALQSSGHWTFSSNQPIKQTKAKTKARPRPTRHAAVHNFTWNTWPGKPTAAFIYSLLVTFSIELWYCICITRRYRCSALSYCNRIQSCQE